MTIIIKPGWNFGVKVKLIYRVTQKVSHCMVSEKVVYQNVLIKLVVVGYECHTST